MAAASPDPRGAEHPGRANVPPTRAGAQRPPAIVQGRRRAFVAGWRIRVTSRWGSRHGIASLGLILNLARAPAYDS
jgi:hypothetical protein